MKMIWDAGAAAGAAAYSIATPTLSSLPVQLQLMVVVVPYSIWVRTLGEPPEVASASSVSSAPAVTEAAPRMLIVPMARLPAAMPPRAMLRVVHVVAPPVLLSESGVVVSCPVTSAMIHAERVTAPP